MLRPIFLENPQNRILGESKTAKPPVYLVADQGDQIGRISAYLAIYFFGQFLKIIIARQNFFP
jgi:hypothetical protein